MVRRKRKAEDMATTFAKTDRTSVTVVDNAITDALLPGMDPDAEDIIVVTNTGAVKKIVKVHYDMGLRAVVLTVK